MTKPLLATIYKLNRTLAMDSQTRKVISQSINMFSILTIKTKLKNNPYNIYKQGKNDRFHC
jgi:hypothetical protein